MQNIYVLAPITFHSGFNYKKILLRQGHYGSLLPSRPGSCLYFALQYAIRIWGRILGLTWLKFAVASLFGLMLAAVRPAHTGFYNYEYPQKGYLLVLLSRVQQQIQDLCQSKYKLRLFSKRTHVISIFII